MFDYRDKITSDKVNRALTPIDSSMDNILEVLELVVKHNTALSFVQPYILNSIENNRIALEVHGMNLTANNNILLPFYVPENSVNIETIGGTFTLEREWRNAIGLTYHGPFQIGSATATIDDLPLTGNDLDLFNGLFSGSNWFIYKVSTNGDHIIKFNIKTLYPVNEIILTGIPSQISQIDLVTPSPTYRYGELFMVDTFNDGEVELTLPTIEHDGNYYVVLNNISMRYSIPAAYGEMVIPLSLESAKTLTDMRLYDVDALNREQFRILICDLEDPITTLTDTSIEYNIFYDTSNDPFPLIGGFYPIEAGTQYLHIILYQESNIIPHIKKLIWEIV